MREQIDVSSGAPPVWSDASPVGPGGRPVWARDCDYRRRGRRRRVSGPRPVRPAVVPVATGPSRVAAPGLTGRALTGRAPGRLRARRHRAAPAGRTPRERLRAAVECLVVAVLSAAVVMTLGLLAEHASAARSPEPAGVVLTHEDAIVHW